MQIKNSRHHSILINIDLTKKPLRKQKIIQVACSSRHGLAITSNAIVYGWGVKNLTLLIQPVFCCIFILIFLQEALSCEI